MKKLRLLEVYFRKEIFPSEIASFRRAVIAIAGMENILFHNHLNDKFRYSYPLIQYKIISGKPAIVCLERGVDEIHHFFNRMGIKKHRLSDRNYTFEIDRIKTAEYTLQVWENDFSCRLLNWLPFNQENYRRFKEMEDDSSKKTQLEKILTGNILSFAKGVNWQVDKEIHVNIFSIDRERIIPVKETKREAFHIRFKTNVFLPPNIGLGKNTSLGYGTVKKAILRKSKTVV